MKTSSLVGESFVKLLSLKVERLYGHYNYDVKFNPDVTFIYGLNGCGKTTILNITEAIITGQIYNLFDYNFNRIFLKYSSRDNDSSMEILIMRLDEESLYLSFEEQQDNIECYKTPNDALPYEKWNMQREHYFKIYPILSSIRNTFNYVYLPLSRSSNVFQPSNPYSFHYYKRYLGMDYDFIQNNSATVKDSSMIRIEGLIEQRYNEIKNEISVINDNFRNEVLKSLININEQYSNYEEMNENISYLIENPKNIKEIETAYIKILKDLSLINDDEESDFSKIFKNIYTVVKNKKSDAPFLIFQLNEISKIKNLVSIAEEMETKKALALEPIEVFLNTMNSFIKNSDDDKEIKIDNMGRVYFVTSYSKEPISIQQLSSGEKQLITFFANLIFKVENNKAGIFVVDEPELSLHLFWQKKFVEKTLGINKNVQLIFATHAPEIIGKNRDKMYKLRKEYVD